MKRIQYRKVRRVLRYHTPNKYRFPEKYAYRFGSEKELLGGNLSTYQGKLAEPVVIGIINNK